MATQNIQIVPQAFKSQQPPFIQGGSQVPITLIDLTKQPPNKKRKINHYFKKKTEVIDLVSSDSEDEIPPPHLRNFRYGKQKMVWVRVRVGDNIYFFEILVNPTSYAIQINTFQVPTSLPTGISAPSNWIGFPTTTYNPQLTILSNFNKIIGFAAGFETPLYPLQTYSVLSTQTPNVQPNSNLLFSVSNINNKYAIPSSIIYSLSPSVSIGSQIIEKPPQFSWNKLLTGTYHEIRLQLLGTDYVPLNILDANMTILLAIRDIKDVDLMSLVEGGK